MKKAQSQIAITANIILSHPEDISTAEIEAHVDALVCSLFDEIEHPEDYVIEKGDSTIAVDAK